MNKKHETVTTTDTDVGNLQSSYRSNENVFVTGMTSSLPTAEEYRDFVIRLYDNSPCEWSEPKYICPKCGGGMCRNNMIVLTTCPPKYEYKCNKCGNLEYQFG